MSSKYIEQYKKDWGIEFAELAGVEYCNEHDEIAAMGCYTLMYHIAANFRDGEFRDEILKMCGVEVPDKPETKPKCSVCGTTENVRWMGGYQPWLCDSPDCIPF